MPRMLHQISKSAVVSRFTAQGAPDGPRLSDLSSFYRIFYQCSGSNFTAEWQTMPVIRTFDHHEHQLNHCSVISYVIIIMETYSPGKLTVKILKLPHWH